MHLTYSNQVWFFCVRMQLQSPPMTSYRPLVPGQHNCAMTLLLRRCNMLQPSTTHIIPMITHATQKHIPATTVSLPHISLLTLIDYPSCIWAICQNHKPECFGYFGRIPLLKTTFWMTNQRETGRYNLPRCMQSFVFRPSRPTIPPKNHPD